MQIRPLILSGAFTAIITTTAITIFSPGLRATFLIESDRQNHKTFVAKDIQSLFATPTSLGALAIGAAEGNYSRNGTKNQIYYGHEDPADYVLNRGFCSDRGRGLAFLQRINPKRKKFSLRETTQAADAQCLKYIRADLQKIITNFQNVGLDPTRNIEAVINAADLRNQANPKVHQRFVVRYAEALKRKDIKNKISWARTMAFYTRRWTSTGLIRICDREKRGLSNFDCTYYDQNRRATEIYYVLKRWKQTN
ncbi:hypothetical protein FD723_40605 (plasmid) [Nostoc sp. C052]|uniref:hypothetical protein n=1 Tax=Nostoc sp. C052 TaxID=2576902 RepID=UPI0015C3BB31|nr:hypothetical protein [Nostoc sp. C052]QLE46516.1 hypothetical protein FD723_40605 [Nostoc sp. C052]